MTGLCRRRQWPEPLYECYRTRRGYTCTVRVNNREYTSDAEYETDELARNAAATRAYMICRSFSVNDGMFPGQKQGQGGIIQGLPVAIGTGRRRSGGGGGGNSHAASHGSGSSSNNSFDGGMMMGGYSDPGSGGSSPRSGGDDVVVVVNKFSGVPGAAVVDDEMGSGGSSPRSSSDSGLDLSLGAGASGGAGRSGKTSGHHHHQHHHLCLCRRGHVRAYGRCTSCLRESGWC